MTPLSLFLLPLLLLAACNRSDVSSNGTMGTARSESARSEISMKLEGAFAKENGMSAVRVAVSRYDNRVTLSGYVLDRKYTAVADSIARAVAPGWQVQNGIRVEE